MLLLDLNQTQSFCFDIFGLCVHHLLHPVAVAWLERGATHVLRGDTHRAPTHLEGIEAVKPLMRSLLVLHGFPNRVLEAICPLVGRHALRSEEVVRIWSSTMVKRGDSTKGRVCASQVKRSLISTIGSTELGGAPTWESSEVMVA